MLKLGGKYKFNGDTYIVEAITKRSVIADGRFTGLTYWRREDWPEHIEPEEGLFCVLVHCHKPATSMGSGGLVPGPRCEKHA